jgi:hypothetical protein
VDGPYARLLADVGRDAAMMSPAILGHATTHDIILKKQRWRYS